MSSREFDLIARIRERVASRDDVVLGIGDDAALLQVPAGQQLVVAMDTLNAGVHFPEETAPADVGWKALAVNLSDLAAMGADPAWCTLSLSMPEGGIAFVDGFLDGFLALAGQHDVALVGGDTTRGPLSVCVTVHGFVKAGMALRRDAACVGDDIWVSGSLGDAAGGLAQWGERTKRGQIDFSRKINLTPFCWSASIGQPRALLLVRHFAASPMPASMYPMACLPTSAMSAKPVAQVRRWISMRCLRPMHYAPHSSGRSDMASRQPVATITSCVSPHRRMCVMRSKRHRVMRALR